MATFQNRDRLAAELRNNWDRVLDALEAALTDEQAAALESQLCPPLSDGEQAAILEDVRARLASNGIDPEGLGIDDRLSAIRQGRLDAGARGVGRAVP